MNFKIISIILLLILLILLLQVEGKTSQSDKKIEDSLTGIWHLSPSLGAGWNDNYHFFSDGTFRYNYSEMDGEKRVINIFGSWHVKERLLFLVIKEKKVIEGGEFIRATGSIATDSELIKGTVKAVELNPWEEIIYPLSPIKKDPENPHLTMIKIGGKKFWKFSNEP